MSIQIQRATIDDLALLAPLFDAYRVFYEQSADLALARHFLEQRLSKQESIIFLALEDATESTSTSAQQRGLGFVQLYPSFSSVSAQRLWILNDLFVAPHARRRGAEARPRLEGPNPAERSTQSRRARQARGE